MSNFTALKMSTSPQKTIIAFDLYGTILSTSSIATKLSELLSISPSQANQVAELWRRYQLEYTWRANSMSTHSLPASNNCIANNISKHV